MSAGDIFLLAVRILILVAGLVLPGAMVVRALRLPPIPALSFVVSAAILYVAIVTFALLHLPISFPTLGGALGLSAAVATAFALRGKHAPPTPETTGPFAWFARMGAWTPLYAIFWGIILWRLATQPLNGGDVDFRWSWLAEQMLGTGTLDFYPPRFAADFAHYFWVESIPPAAAGLHAWAYACGGSTNPLWASAGVLLQVLVVHELIWRLAVAWSGVAAARLALVIAIATPMLSWSTIMGQETGLTALAVCGLCFAVIRWHQTRADSWFAVAAAATVLAAGTREYGGVFVLLGLALLAVVRAPRRGWITFAAIAVPLAAAWPVRVWALTGNPFYSLDLAHRFPTNAVFVDWAASISSGASGTFTSAHGWALLLRYAAICAPLSIFGWLALAAAGRRRNTCALCLLAVAVLTIALWIASVPYTGGGLFYSLRVLSPAFAIAAVAGGVGWAALDGMSRIMVSVAVTVVAVITLPTTLTLPHNPLHLPIREWANAGQVFKSGAAAADAQLGRHLATLPGHERILSECVSLPHSFRGRGIDVVPMWSPEVDWLFDRALAPAERARRWQNSGLRYVVMTRSPAQLELLARRAAWSRPQFRVEQEWQSDAYVVFDVSASP